MSRSHTGRTIRRKRCMQIIRDLYSAPTDSYHMLENVKSAENLPINAFQQKFWATE